MNSTTDAPSVESATKVNPAKRLHGEIYVPGDKSISHRAAMLAALSEGRSIIRNYLTGADCLSTLSCLSSLGVQIKRDDSTVTVEGVGLYGLKAPHGLLDAGNSGTTTRLLSGILAGQPFTSTITGDESLRSRPMRRVTEPLRQMGATLETEPNGCAPLRITGARPLKAIHYQLPVASAQIESAVLLAGLYADGRTSVEEPTPTRDHSERMLREFGAQVEREGDVISIKGGAKLTARDCLVPGDISSAAFFVAAAVILPDSHLVIRDVGLNPTRTAFLNVVEEMGGKIKIEDQRTSGGEPVGTLRIEGRSTENVKPVKIGGSIIANLIDELPLLAFTAAAINCELIVSDARELRVKESDRIATTVENLRRMGAKVEMQDDGWHIHQSSEMLKGARLESYGDHRIAMSCAVAALSAESPPEIEGASQSVGVSLPQFWRLLESLTS